VPELGVRFFLFLVLSVCAVLPVGLLGSDQARRWAQSEIAATDRQALGAARSAADQLSLAMLGYVHAAEALSAQVGARPALARADLAAALNSHVNTHPEFLGAYVANAEGTALLNGQAGMPVAAGGISYKDREYYLQIVATHRTAVSSVHIGRYTQKLTVQVASPVLGQSGELLGLTCSSVDLGGVTAQAQETVRGMVDGRVVVIDGEGRLIADSKATSPLALEDVSKLALFAPLLTGDPELRSGLDEDQNTVRGIAVGLKPPVHSWRVVAMTPQAVVDSQTRHVKYQTAALALGLMLVALALSALVAAWLARPLRALAATADAVTRGELTLLPTPVRGAPKEMALVTRAIGAMIERLRSHAEELELTVVRRTEELSLANSKLSGALTKLWASEHLLKEDIARARLFQEKILPRLPSSGALDLAVHYAPLERVSGDIYDITELGPGHLRLFVADVTGHGVQASMRTIWLKSEYDRIKTQHRTPDRLLAALNARLVADFPDGDLHCGACACDLLYSVEGGLLLYSDAGGGPVYVLGEQGARELTSSGPLLAVDTVDWPQPERFRIAPGELLLIASDGLSEQFNAQRERFESRLVCVRYEPGESASEALARLLVEFEHFRGDTAVNDDITAITVRMTLR
jgi:serine phosphatase RsbU (regulator of sigma subunit)